MTTIVDYNLEFRSSNKHGGEWLWPADEFIAWRYLHKGSWDLPARISNICKDRSLVIQAGGNGGLYPKQYSQLFDTVLTFEPDYRNFTCLSYNVPELNVFKFQAFLGNESKFLNFGYNPRWENENRGAMKVQPSGNKVPQLTIDSLDVNPSLIHLDIEGYEGFAIEGAEKTIKRSRPIIVLETNGSGDEYGWPQEKIDSLILSWGYKILVDWGHDKVYGV
jgi:FkbM family methyltransferase